MAGKSLIIVESPTKATTISRFLGNNCRIIASKGHIRTLPKIGLAINIDKGYEPQYIIDDTKKQVIADMKEALKSADELILATDEDREGESISWHLKEVLKPKVPTRRMVFHEITKKAITEAFAKGRELDMNLVHAQEARRILDRLYGYTISPVLWSKLSNKTLSAGRVQSPGLRLIVDREKSRINFKKAEYWDIQAVFEEKFSAKLERTDGIKTANGQDFNKDTGIFNPNSKARLLDFQDTQVIISSLKNSIFTVTDIKEKESVQHPFPPFKTSTLQQEGNRKLHLSAKDTMSVAQSLYEKGFITYMRTDSLELSQEGINAARNAVIETYGSSFVSPSPRHYSSSSAVAQEAHEAIRPAGETFVKPEESGLSGRELALYSIIYKRTLACQMKDAIKAITTVSISASGCDFTTTGTRIEYPGFIKVYVESSDEDEEDLKILPKLKTGQILNVAKLEPVKHETKALPRYTEASLVQELEKLEIGRPSTYAAIIERILDKKYVVKEGGALVPTFTGFGVIQLLENFKQYMNYDFTSKMEKDLDEIAQGNVKELEYLRNFYEGENGLEKQVGTIKDAIVPMDVKRIKLPQISKEHTITIGKYGPYVQDSEGKYYSVPESWKPYSVTDEMIEDLMTNAESKSATPVLGTTSEGLPVLYCTGRYGDYWQIGDISKTKDVKRFKVPASLIGKEVPLETILAFFNLPRTVGTAEDGSIITADIGRFGPYLKCNEDYRNLKDINALFEISQSGARFLFSTPKESKKATSSKKTYVKKSAGTSAKTKTGKDPEVVKDFGEIDGSRLFITSGRYGFYIKHGEKNIRIPAKYQHDEELCKSMTQEEAVSYSKK